MKDDKFGVFEDLVNLAEENLKPIVRELRNVILEIESDACEVVRLADRWVNLGVYQGAHLHDPEPLLEGTGKKYAACVKIRSLEESNQPAIKALIQAALSERRNALNA